MTQENYEMLLGIHTLLSGDVKGEAGKQTIRGWRQSPPLFLVRI